MDKQKQIEEMAKDIARILLEDCLINIGVSCADCEWNDKETKEYDCQSLLVAKKLIEKYQPKIPKNAVVLTRERYEWLTCCFGKFEEIMNDVKKSARKETAEKFAERLKAKCEYNRKEYRCSATVGVRDIDEICKELTEGKE